MLRVTKSSFSFSRPIQVEKPVLFRALPACKESSVRYSLGLVDFAIGLVNSVINLPDGQVKFFEEFE